MQENQAKGMATHFSILALRIPWTEEPGGLQSMGLQRNRHNWGAKHEAWWTWAIFQSIGYLSGFSSISPFCYWTKVTLKIKLLIQPESRSSEKKPTCSLVYLKQHHQSIIRVLGDTSQPTAFPTTVMDDITTEACDNTRFPDLFSLVLGRGHDLKARLLSWQGSETVCISGTTPGG